MFVYFCGSISQNQLVNLQSNLQVMGESDNNTAAVQGADGKVRCVNTEPEVPKCEVSSRSFHAKGLFTRAVKIIVFLSS